MEQNKNFGIFSVIPLTCDPQMAVTYLLVIGQGEEALVVDPGQPAARITEELRKRGKRCGGILLTHGHYDHIRDLDTLCERWDNPPVYMGEKDREALVDPMKNVSFLFGEHHKSQIAPSLIKEGDTLSLCGLTVTVLATPGHTEGSVCYLVSVNGTSCLLSGDTLFYDSVGRWDFPGGDGRTLLSSIQSLFERLPEDTPVYPGHGQPTTLSREKRENLFLIGS